MLKLSAKLLLFFEICKENRRFKVERRKSKDKKYLLIEKS